MGVIKVSYLRLQVLCVNMYLLELCFFHHSFYIKVFLIFIQENSSLNKPFFEWAKHRGPRAYLAYFVLIFFLYNRIPSCLACLEFSCIIFCFRLFSHFCCWLFFSFYYFFNHFIKINIIYLTSKEYYFFILKIFLTSLRLSKNYIASQLL
jgi:hypothetical protein